VPQKNNHNSSGNEYFLSVQKPKNMLFQGSYSIFETGVHTFVLHPVLPYAISYFHVKHHQKLVALVRDNWYLAFENLYFYIKYPVTSISKVVFLFLPRQIVPHWPLSH